MASVAMSPQGRQIMLLEPVMPVKTIILSVDDPWHIGDMNSHVKKYIDQGYIIKSLSPKGDASIVYIILEKY